MLVTPLLFALFACIAFAEQTTIYHDGVFSGLLYESALTQKDGTTTLSFAYTVSTCVSSLSVEATEKATAVLETITRHHQGVFVWEPVASAEIVNGKASITLPEAKCTSRFRVVLTNGDFSDVSVDSETLANPTARREVSCVGTAGTWAKPCGTAPEGQLCLETESCGCKQDADCFANAVLPYCNTVTRLCESCFKSPRSGTINGVRYTNFSGHYFCRARYPTRYLTDSKLDPRPDLVKMITREGERTPDITGTDFGGYYKEICSNISPDPQVTQGVETLGSCDRCDQAAYLADIWLPKYDFPATNVIRKPNEGPKGTYFCRFIRGSPVAGINDMNLITSREPTPQRPICSTLQYFQQVGLGDMWNKLTASEEVRSWGDQNGNVNGPAQDNVVLNRTLDDWDGACVPCYLGEANGVKRAYHGLCSFALALNNVSGQDIKISTPICSAATGGCAACTSNADCQLGDETQGPFKTGGPNCMTAGHCIFCRSDADCGGDLNNDPKCGANGVCGAREVCNANFDEDGTAKCATNALQNCYKDGTCKDCRQSGCPNDGGKVGDQQICEQATGICRSCTTNAQCGAANLGNALNCYQDGVCRDCVAAGCNNDGGQPGAIAGCTTVAGFSFCTEKSGQPLCNTVTRRCEDLCLSNDYCTARTNAITAAGGGANCQADGTCFSCSPAGGSTANPAPNCGTNDGPRNDLAGRSGLSGETNCGGSGICFNEARCTRNEDCPAIGGGNNCQVTGGCISCAVTHETTTCSGNDGGQPAGQPNCNLASRLCVGGCNNENDCVGTQGANCMANQVCHDCRSNADCQANNAWRGDRIGRTLCVNKLCTFACDSNLGGGGAHPCGADAPNCNNDGTCIRCTGASCTADGPPGAGGNTVCGPNGICVNPFLCTTGGPGGGNADNAGCQAHYNNDGLHNNCNIDGSCTNCVNNAGCQANDGGSISYQPRCDPQSKTCVGCQSNADCPPERANCYADGSCKDCRGQGNNGTRCIGGSLQDGPPGTARRNRNCDPLTGICVDFCIQDSDCMDACKPRCQLERGCCVECLDNIHCPVPQWRGTEKALKTQCDKRNGYQCTYEITCTLDADCSNPAFPACSFSENKCVECRADAHCPRGVNATGACDVGRERCVQCISNAHCPAPTHICDPRSNYCVQASAFSVSASLFLSLAVLFLTYF